MSTPEAGRRVLAPGDPVADAWMTRTGVKRVLAVAPHLQAATRLAFDVLPHLETDLRIQVVWSVPDTGYRWDRLDKFVRDLEGLVVPWTQAIEGRYDLILAACFWGLADTTGPKFLLPHGVNGIRSRIGPHPGPIPHDMTREKLMRAGEIVPAALVFPHESELAELENTCAEALPRAVVAGDPCFDRMLASRRMRRSYRRALGVRKGQKLVVVSTTWSKHSLFGTDETIFTRLVAALPRRKYRVVAVLHPFIWHGHSPRAVLGWLAAARAAGLVLLPPEEGWRAALVAADLVLGDHGSVTQYAAALNIPVLLNARSLVDVRESSTAATLARLATLLDLDAPLQPQVRRAMDRPPPDGFGDLVISHHGQSASILRRTCYDIMGIPEPPEEVRVPPLPLPNPLGQATLVGGLVGDNAKGLTFRAIVQ